MELLKVDCMSVIKGIAKLLDEGFTRPDLERVCSPVDLNIEAETPEENAVRSWRNRSRSEPGKAYEKAPSNRCAGSCRRLFLQDGKLQALGAPWNFHPDRGGRHAISQGRDCGCEGGRRAQGR